MALIFAEEFQTVCRYIMRGGKPQDVEILDTMLWDMRGVVYARTCGDKVVYIGSTDRLLSTRIRREHLRGIGTSLHGTAPRYREWAEGKQITIVAYKPEPVRLFGRDIQIHRGVEAALITEFQRPGEPDWFVARA